MSELQQLEMDSMRVGETRLLDLHNLEWAREAILDLAGVVPSYIAEDNYKMGSITEEAYREAVTTFMSDLTDADKLAITLPERYVRHSDRFARLVEVAGCDELSDESSRVALIDSSAVRSANFLDYPTYKYWGDLPTECLRVYAPRLDLQISLETDKPISVYGQDPLPSPGYWYRFTLSDVKFQALTELGG